MGTPTTYVDTYSTEIRKFTKCTRFSDGPTTHYRCKDNFYILSKVPIELGYQHINWSFMEAGQGKGAPDGIGAAVKWEADRAVLHGQDITDAKTLLEVLKTAIISLDLFLISEEDVLIEESSIPQQLRTVSGTMKIHQVCT